MRLRRRSDGEIRDLRAGMLLGRHAGADWHLDDPSVSRRHARVVCEGDAWLLEDLGSSNGTLLNGVAGQRLVLRPDDLVTLGGVAFDVLGDEVEAGAPPAAATAVADGGAAAAAERERARLHAQLRRPQRSRGFGDLGQQSPAVRALALALGLLALAGVAVGVRFVARLL